MTGDPVLKEEVKEFAAEADNFFRKMLEEPSEAKPAKKKRVTKKKEKEQKILEEFAEEEVGVGEDARD
jgi:hypothetical protein